MRKTISKWAMAAGVIICSANANAQWTITGTVVHPTVLNNNVSVGTTINGANIYVEKAAAVTLGIKSTTAGATMFMDKAVAAANAAFAYKIAGTVYWNSGMLGGVNFQVRNVQLNSFPIVVNSATDFISLCSTGGRVGIGTAAPTEMLEVNGNMRAVGNMGATGNVNAGLNVNALGNITAGGNVDVAGYVGFGSVEQLTDGGSFTIASNSDFEPTTDCGRDLGSTTKRWSNVYACDGISVGTTSSTSKLNVDGGVDLSPTSAGYAVIGTPTGLNIGIDNNEIMARDNGVVAPLYLQNSGGNLILCAASGNVSIGTSTAATGYILSVDGKVMAEEVRVELSGNWPDYVFGNEYKLMSLESLENHIATNKHLPGVPSAIEVENNGLHLGQMQITTIEKVEENTLYIIQLNKKLEAQNMVIDKLVKEIEALKSSK